MSKSPTPEPTPSPAPVPAPETDPTPAPPAPAPQVRPPTRPAPAQRTMVTVAKVSEVFGVEEEVLREAYDSGQISGSLRKGVLYLDLFEARQFVRSRMLDGRQRLGYVVTVANRKGGSGKTTTTINLAFQALQQIPDSNVLVLDLDPQAHTGKWLRTNETLDAMRQSLREQYPTLDDERLDEQLPKGLEISLDANLSQGLVSSIFAYEKEPGLFLAHAFDEKAFDTLLAQRCNVELVAERWLAKLVAPLKQAFDFIFIDTPPYAGSNFALHLALAASDGVVIPVDRSHLSVEGTLAALRTVEGVREYLNPHLEVLAGFINMDAPGTRNHRVIDQMIAPRFGAAYFANGVRQVEGMRQFPGRAEGPTIGRGADGAVQDFANLFRFVLYRLKEVGRARQA